MLWVLCEMLLEEGRKFYSNCSHSAEDVGARGDHAHSRRSSFDSDKPNK